MSYTSKYTASEIDEKLTTVFESILQNKNVEITEDTIITPDEGYLALKSVNISVAGGGGTETSSMEYLDVSGLDVIKKQMLIMICVIARAGVSIVPPLVFIGEGLSLSDIVSYTSMCGIDFETPVHYSSTDYSIKEFLMQSAFTEEELAAIPRITKEQFYNLEA